ncbi:hypothetical protein RIF29_37665 [Crotalaria pallida]|uniref:Uncharacterized protein n=1 Tax=Crotalaria pallida TaxID=3830 RepID=A0AAN9EJ74_CROPI
MTRLTALVVSFFPTQASRSQREFESSTHPQGPLRSLELPPSRRATVLAGTTPFSRLGSLEEKNSAAFDPRPTSKTVWEAGGDQRWKDTVEYRSTRRGSSPSPIEQRSLGLILTLAASCRTSCHYSYLSSQTVEDLSSSLCFLLCVLAIYLSIFDRHSFIHSPSLSSSPFTFLPLHLRIHHRSSFFQNPNLQSQFQNIHTPD